MKKIREYLSIVTREEWIMFTVGCAFGGMLTCMAWILFI